MGLLASFIRSNKDIFKEVKKKPEPVKEENLETVKETEMRVRGSGYNRRNILTSETMEQEANTSKTVLGGGKKKNIKI